MSLFRGDKQRQTMLLSAHSCVNIRRRENENYIINTNWNSASTHTKNSFHSQSIEKQIVSFEIIHKKKVQNKIHIMSFPLNKNCSFISNSGISYVFAFGVVIIFIDFLMHSVIGLKKDFQTQFFNLQRLFEKKTVCFSLKKKNLIQYAFKTKSLYKMLKWKFWKRTENERKKSIRYLNVAVTTERTNKKKTLSRK